MRAMPFGSRFFLAPINTGFAVDGVPTEELVRFHEERSGRGVGVGYVGNVAISQGVRSNEGTAVISRAHRDVWEGVCRTIEERGTVPAIQLACKVAARPSLRRWTIADRDEFISEMSQALSALHTDAVESVCHDFVVAGSVALDAGFKVIQIHAAHGYLLALLLNRVINQRQDAFGADGVRALELIAQGLRAVSSEFVLDVRVSLFDGLEDEEAERSYRSAQLGRLTQVGYDMISLSAGMYDLDRRMIYPGRRDGNRVYVHHAAALASAHPRSLWNVAGNLGRISELVDHPCQNLTFSIGRPLIADPMFIEKSLTGREAEIVQCAFTGRCHYFSRGKMHLECGVNSSLGRR